MRNIKSIKDLYFKFNYILTKRQKLYAIVVFVLTLIGAILETLGVSSIVPFVQAIMNSEKISQMVIVRIISQFFLVNSQRDIVGVMCILLILVYLIKNLYLSFLSYIRVHFSTQIQKELSLKMMYSYMQRNYVFFTSVNSGELLQGIGGDISAVYQMLYHFFRIFSEIITIIALSIYIIYEDWRMAITVISLAVLCFGIIVFVFQKPMERFGKEYRNANALVNKRGIQAFQGIKEIIVMNRQNYFVKSYEKATIKRQKAMIWQTLASELPAYVIEAVCVVGLIMAVGIRVISGENIADYIPKLASFAVAAFRILPSLGRISSGFNQFIYYNVSLDSVYYNLKGGERYKEQEFAHPSKLKSVDCEGKDNSKYLEVENVTWSYCNNISPIINGLNLQINEGESIGIIGQSGTGKTTLIDIIMGLYIPLCGSVKYRGRDIQEMKETWCQLIGYIPQNIYLVDDTIKRNIAFGIADEKIDEQFVWNALEYAQLKEFVESLPDGIETIIGERGVRLSGGQRQRIAIARALYYNPSILVLDEATSALDVETERAVMEAVDRLQGQKTLIIVAHRLTTIRNCDKIYEIIDGKAILRDKKDVIKKGG